MLSFTGSLKVYVTVEPCDMRKGYHGLQALVAQRLGADVKSGALFCFCNRQRTRLKVLYWDGTGLWVMTKRLEKGTFSWPKAGEAGQVKLRLVPEVFAMLNDEIPAVSEDAPPGMSVNSSKCSS